MSKRDSAVSGTYIAASYAALFIGGLSFLIGLWNAAMPLTERGYYFTLLLFGLFAAVTVQKSVRDKEEGIPVSARFMGIAYLATLSSLLLLTVGLWNANLVLSEKGFYATSFILALFGSVTVQKNIRDVQAFEAKNFPTNTTELS